MYNRAHKSLQPSKVAKPFIINETVNSWMQDPRYKHDEQYTSKYIISNTLTMFDDI